MDRKKSMLKLSLVVIALLMSATSAECYEYWPADDGATFTFISPSFEGREYSIQHSGPTSRYGYKDWIGVRFTVKFDHDQEGNLRLVGSTASILTDVRETFLDRPIVLLPADPLPGTTWVHAGTCTVSDGRTPNDVFAFIARITLVGFETITVPAGTFETIKLNIENAWPQDFNGIVHLHRQLGIVKFRDFELESWTGTVATEQSSWGSVKAMFR